MSLSTLFEPRILDPKDTQRHYEKFFKLPKIQNKRDFPNGIFLKDESVLKLYLQ